MPLLGIDDFISDPDFAQPSGAVVVVRTTQTVSTGGLAEGTSVSTPITAIVYPERSVFALGIALGILADAARVSGSIKVVTRYRLRAGTTALAPDQILWSGNTYLVTRVEDYSNYGAGFVIATAELQTTTMT